MASISRRTALSGAAAAAALAQLPLAANASTRYAVDAALRQAVSEGRVAGVVGLAGSAQGELYAGAFGARSVAAGAAPMTLDSVFWIASMTKAVTTTAAMQMVEQGKLGLDKPSGEILPELAAPQVLEGFDAAGAPKLRPARGTVTLRKLLTHTAGFTYDIWDADNGRYRKYANVPSIITCKDDALKTPLAFDPGERWDYGTNIDFAGKMVEKVSGKRLEDYFRDHIFGPLGMHDTSFRISPSQRQRLVAMHAREADGRLKPIEFEIPQEPEFQMGGGGLYSTGPNYLRFVRMFLNEGRLDGAQVLKPETVAEMSRNQIGELDVTLLKTQDPDSSADAEFFPGMVKKWGLGFVINTEEAPTGRSRGSLAWAGLANTFFWIDPQKDMAGVILMQLLPFADPAAMKTFAEFETALYQAAAPGVGSSTPPRSRVR